jgi:hypothetical protein
MYQIEIMQNDGTYSPYLTYCDGSDSVIKANKVCSVPVISLKAEPFDIQWAGSVYAKIIAKNIYGSSVESDGGNGASLQTNPDPPI